MTASVELDGHVREALTVSCARHNQRGD